MIEYQGPDDPNPGRPKVDHLFTEATHVGYPGPLITIGLVFLFIMTVVRCA